MLVSKSTRDGLQVSGYADTPSMVLVTWKAESGESRTSAIEVGGLFFEDMTMKGRVQDIIVLPMLKARRTLYVHRPVLNADEIGAWFRAQGMETVSVLGDMHVTIAHSKAEVDWEALGAHQDHVTIPADNRRQVKPLGNAGAMVLKFESPELEGRWSEFLKAGASWDFPSYQPHVTLTYGADPNAVFLPYAGPILLGPECFAELNPDYKAVEKGAHGD